MVYLIGDTHAQFRRMAVDIAIGEISNSTLIQVGDFGAGFKQNEAEEFEYINGLLGLMNNRLYVIRGNHDDPAYFFEERKTGNITFLNDYSIIDADNKKILLVGGAVSIDRRIRTEGISYWKEETFVYNGEKLCTALAGIDRLDIVVTHSAPSEFWPYGYDNNVHNFISGDKDLHADLVKDRAGHSRLMKHLVQCGLQPQAWYYGHYHARYAGRYNGIRYRTLGPSEIFQHL